MASFSITKRKKADGSFSYRCGIVVKRDGVIIHREYKTFREKNEIWRLMSQECSIWPLSK